MTIVRHTRQHRELELFIKEEIDKEFDTPPWHPAYCAACGVEVLPDVKVCFSCREEALQPSFI